MFWNFDLLAKFFGTYKNIVNDIPSFIIFTDSKLKFFLEATAKLHHDTGSRKRSTLTVPMQFGGDFCNSILIYKNDI